MECKHCRKEIPDESVNCPRCGGRQIPYTTKRPSKPEKRRRASRAGIMSLGMIAFCVVLVVVLQPILESNHRQEMLANVETAYNALLNGTGTKETVYNQTRALYDKYPDSDEAQAALVLYCASVGVDISQVNPEDIKNGNLEAVSEAAKVGGEVDARQREILLARAHDEILQVDQVRIEGPGTNGQVDIRIQWKNMSAKTIKTIVFSLEAFDDEGKLAPCEVRGDSAVKLSPNQSEDNKTFAPSDEATPFYVNLYLNVYTNPRIAHIYLTRVSITYDDDTRVVLDGDIIPTILDVDGYVYRGKSF